MNKKFKLDFEHLLETAYIVEGHRCRDAVQGCCCRGCSECEENYKHENYESEKDTHCSDKCCGSDVKREDCKCPPDCPHCNCNAVSEGKGKSNKQKAAIAIAKKDKYKESLANKLGNKLAETKAVCKDCGNPSYTTLPEEKQKGVDGKVCWKGYKRMGTKKKGGKTVDNCVKM